jgi:alkylation response protein AidB-like acyl-CoA dehydrogenase
VEITSQNTLDPSRSHASINFKDAEADILGADVDGWIALQEILDRAAVLFAFEQLGGAEACMNMAKEYAMGRFAFGRPIASFQAIKHKIADMYIAVELARSNCYFGAWALSTDAPELPTAAATSRVSASKAFHECSKENIQTHGGMGFTWEFDCHLYYRRCRQLAANIGSQAVWKNKLISSLERANQI